MVPVGPLPQPVRRGSRHVLRAQVPVLRAVPLLRWLLAGARVGAIPILVEGWDFQTFSVERADGRRILWTFCYGTRRSASGGGVLRGRTTTDAGRRKNNGPFRPRT